MTSFSTFHQLLSAFDKTFRKLDYNPTHLEFEKWSILIGEVMSARWRHYHTPHHVLEMCKKTSDPIERLAILFHDLVYIQVDRRIHPRVQRILYDFIINERYEVTLPEISKRGEGKLINAAYQIFNVQSGDILTPKTGSNELLSAIAAIRILRPYLSTWEIIQILGCIEATIPFRPDPPRTGVTHRLWQELQTVNEKLRLKKSDQSIKLAVKRSVNVANNDLQGFCIKDPNAFLFDTWKIILEGNPVFKNPFYTVNQYVAALEKVDLFYSRLNPETVPKKFDNTPQKAHFDRLISQATKNIETGKSYLRINILSASILKAIADLTGGDAPMVLFLGKIGDYKRTSSTLERHLDRKYPRIPANLYRKDLFDLFEKGRSGPSAFDLKHSPLSAFLYSRLHPGVLKNGIAGSRALNHRRMTPIAFLQIFPTKLIQSLLDSVSLVASSRAEPISELQEALIKRSKRNRTTQTL